jgi:hypothetical protein
MLFDIEDALQPNANSPKHRDIGAEPACEAASTRQFARVEDAQERECNDRQHHVAAVDPVHLLVET